MQVKIVRFTENPIDAIASAYAITRGLSYDEYLQQYNTEEKKKKLILSCYESGHMSGFEFVDIDIEILGCSRVFEVDKVRSRIASYEVEAGSFTAKRDFETVIPPGIDKETANKRIEIIRQWFKEDTENGVDPRNARYFTHQGLSRRMRVKKNFRALIETSWLRMCMNAQWEYRLFMDLVKEEVNKIDPFFADFLNPKCVHLGYCNEVWNTCHRYPKKSFIIEY